MLFQVEIVDPTTQKSSILLIEAASSEQATRLVEEEVIGLAKPKIISRTPWK